MLPCLVGGFFGSFVDWSVGIVARCGRIQYDIKLLKFIDWLDVGRMRYNFIGQFDDSAIQYNLPSCLLAEYNTTSLSGWMFVKYYTI